MDRQVSYKKKFIWNMLGSLSNAFSTLILSISVNRILGGEFGGIFAFAYSNAQLMLTIGNFEMYPLQSTDIEEKYKFDTYFWFKIFACIIMIITTGGYILIERFDFEKSIIVFFLSLFKTVEAFTSVYGGRFHQCDRIDLTGKIFFIRVVVSTIAFIMLMILTNSLVIASIGIFLCSFSMFFLYDKRFIFEQDKRIGKVKFVELISLFKDVIPLFIGSFVMMYLSNAPKYAINNNYGDNIQNIYNLLFMPAFVINIFSLFIFRPMLGEMTKNWLNGKFKDFWKSVIIVFFLIICATTIALIGSWFWGIPVLSLLYGIELSNYRIDLVLVMGAGGISALMTFSYYLITVMRQQKLLLIGYAISMVYAVSTANLFVKRLGIRGAIFSYGSSISILVFVYIAITIGTYILKKNSIYKIK